MRIGKIEILAIIDGRIVGRLPSTKLDPVGTEGS
jgi:hypothetical protein